MTEELYDYDPAEALGSPEASRYSWLMRWRLAMPPISPKAMGVLARAKGMTELAREAGLSGE